MKLLMITYRLVILIVLIATFYSCASEDRSESKAFAPTQNEYNGQSATIDEESTFEEVETVQNTDQLKKEMSNSLSHSKKWKKKAKQQLETIQDLALILKDSTLEPDFKIEIENELTNIYPNYRQLTFIKPQQTINFKRFKFHDYQDTLIVEFKNNKALLSASFIVTTNSKTFGNQVEQIEQLQLIKLEEK